MRGMYSLRTIVPVLITALVVFYIAVIVIIGVGWRKSTIIDEAKEDIQQTVARLTRLAETLSFNNRQILEDYLTQEGADTRVAVALITDHDDKIIFSTNFAWRGQSFQAMFPWYDEKTVRQAKQIRKAVVDVRDGGRIVWAAINFSEPATTKELRGLNKGLVVIAYDLKNELENVLPSTLMEHAIDFSYAIFACGFIVLFISRFVARPVEKLRNAANNIASGIFEEPLDLRGSKEIFEVGKAFNTMSSSLRESLMTLGEYNQKTKKILDNVIDGIITIDEKNNIASFNVAAQKMFGYQEQEIIGKPISLLMPDISEHSLKLARDGEEVDVSTKKRTMELGGVRKNGEIFPVEFAGNSTEEYGRKICIGIVRDITERKKIDRLKSEFIATVSHELRTPLTALNGSIGLLSAGATGELPGPAKEILKVAQRNGERLLALINDLLDMEKILAGKMKFELKETSLQTVIREAIHLNGEYSSKFSIKINFEDDGGNIRVKVDEVRLIQVLSNLISNACKFSPPGAAVNIVPEIREDRVRVSVVDRGEGIPEAFKARIFHKFSQADSSDIRKRGGTGLGLAISKGIIENMHGIVGFDSKEGHGSTFYFELPLAG